MKTNKAKREYAKAYRKSEAGKIAEKRRRAKRSYGISLEEYEERMNTSKVCELCGTDKQLCYDHCHETMRFRGVLCRSCNTALGKLGDTEQRIAKALKYLKREK